MVTLRNHPGDYVSTLASITAVALTLFITTAGSSGQQTPTHVWLNLMISAPVASTQSTESLLKLGAESFINYTCQPSGLDGIHVLSVQTGHNEVFHLHVFCRQDRAGSVHYKTSLIPVPNHKVDETAKTIIDRPDVRVGPLYLGSTGEADGIFVIEKQQ